MEVAISNLNIDLFTFSILRRLNIAVIKIMQSNISFHDLTADRNVVFKHVLRLQTVLKT